MTNRFQTISPGLSQDIEDWLIDQNTRRRRTVEDTAKAVRNARRSQRMTQAQLALRIGSTQASISRLESGRLSDVGMQMLQRIGSALELETRVVFVSPTDQ